MSGGTLVEKPAAAGDDVEEEENEYFENEPTKSGEPSSSNGDKCDEAGSTEGGKSAATESTSGEIGSPNGTGPTVTLIEVSTPSVADSGGMVTLLLPSMENDNYASLFGGADLDLSSLDVGAAEKRSQIMVMVNKCNSLKAHLEHDEKAVEDIMKEKGAFVAALEESRADKAALKTKRDRMEAYLEEERAKNEQELAEAKARHLQREHELLLKEQMNAVAMDAEEAVLQARACRQETDYGRLMESLREKESKQRGNRRVYDDSRRILAELLPGLEDQNLLSSHQFEHKVSTSTAGPSQDSSKSPTTLKYGCPIGDHHQHQMVVNPPLPVDGFEAILDDSLVRSLGFLREMGHLDDDLTEDDESEIARRAKLRAAKESKRALSDKMHLQEEAVVIYTHQLEEASRLVDEKTKEVEQLENEAKKQREDGDAKRKAIRSKATDEKTKIDRHAEVFVSRQKAKEISDVAKTLAAQKWAKDVLEEASRKQRAASAAKAHYENELKALKKNYESTFAEIKRLEC